MADIKIYFLKKEINKLKENLNINLDEVKEDLKEEAKKSIENFINFLNNALTSNKNADNIIKDVNSEINSFNDKINDIMKQSIKLPPMVNVMPDLSADDFYDNKTFAENIKLTENEYFNKFADNENINDELLDKLILLDEKIEETNKSDNKENIKNLYKERAEIYNQLSMPSYAIEDCNKAIEIDENDINLQFLKLDILKKDNKVNANEIIKCYDDIIDLDKNSLENHYKKIEYLKYLESLDLFFAIEEDIIKCYDDIIDLDKNNLESYYKKIEYLKSLNGRQEEIINCSNGILNIDSNNIKALYIIADEYRKQADKTSNEDDYKKALEYYNKVKSIDENYNNVQYSEEYCLDKINYNENLQKEIKYYYDKAEAFFELGKYQEALNCADKAVSLDETYYKSYYFKGSLLKNIENYDEAIECFDKAIEINNQDFDSYYNKALILFELGRYEEKEFNNITKLGETSYNLYYKGLTLYRERKYAEAVNEFDEAIKLNNANNYNNEAYYYKGLYLFELKKYDEALESFKSTNNFNRYDIYYFLGEIYETKNNYKEAIKYYEEALKNYKEKNNSRDYYIIGMTLYKLSLFDKAIDNFNKALSFIFEDNKNLEDILNYCNNILKLEKNNKVFYAYKIITLILLNRYDEALSLEKNNESLDIEEVYKKALNILKDKNKINNDYILKGYDKAISLNPQNIETYREKIQFLKSIKENKLTIECYDKIIESNPNNIESYREKIQFLKSIKENDLVIECYDKIIESNPNNIESYREKIDFLKSIKENDLVIECYDKIIESNPNNIESYREKIDFLKSIEENDLVIECYDKAIKLNPNDAEAYKGKADIYYKINNYNSAIYKGKAKIYITLADKNSYDEEKYYNLAIECYDKMIEANPQNIERYREKIELLNQLADKNSSDRRRYYNLAIEYYDKIIELNPNDVEAYKGKADTCYQLANTYSDSYDREKYYKLAIKSYDKAIKLKPSSELYYDKYNTLCNLNRRSEANECYRKFEELKKLGK